jgi:sugar/nucleoside kinase (ribokinase family)
MTESSNKSPVLVVGSVAFDAIKTPTAESGRTLGGSATYAGIAASYFSPTRLVGVVGKDFGDENIGRLKARGIDLEGLQVDNSGDTFFWSGVYGDNFATRTTLDTQLNVFADFKPTLPAGYKASPFVLLGNIQPSLQAMVLDQLEPGGFVAADTMNLWIDIAKDDLLALLPRIDMLILNDEEAEQLTEKPNVFEAGEKLLLLGPRIVLIKKGQHGAVLFHPEGLFALPVYPVTRVEDPTGAGDSFAGALVGFLASQGNSDFATIKQAAAYATVTASLTVEALGVDHLETAGREKIDARYAELVKMMTLN